MVPVPRLRRPCGLGRALRSRRRESHPAGRAAARLPMAAHPRQRLPRLRADGRPAGHGEARRGQPRRDDRPDPGRTGRREGTVHRPARQRRLAGRAAAFVGALGAPGAAAEQAVASRRPRTAHRPRIGALRLHRLHRLSLLPPGIRQTRPLHLGRHGERRPAKHPRPVPRSRTTARQLVAGTGVQGIDAQQLDAVVQFGRDPVLPADGEGPGAARPGRGPVGPIHGPVPQLHPEGRGLRGRPRLLGRGGREGLRLPPDPVRRLGRRILAVRQRTHPENGRVRLPLLHRQRLRRQLRRRRSQAEQPQRTDLELRPCGGQQGDDRFRTLLSGRPRKREIPKPRHHGQRRLPGARNGAVQPADPRGRGFAEPPCGRNRSGGGYEEG